MHWSEQHKIRSLSNGIYLVLRVWIVSSHSLVHRTNNTRYIFNKFNKILLFIGLDCFDENILEICNRYGHFSYHFFFFVKSKREKCKEKVQFFNLWIFIQSKCLSNDLMSKFFFLFFFDSIIYFVFLRLFYLLTRFICRMHSMRLLLLCQKFKYFNVFYALRTNYMTA